MATILVQAKESIPLSKNGALLQLQAFNGADGVQDLCSGKKLYQHMDSLHDFHESLGHVVIEELHSEIASSEYRFFALEVDEATDSSNTSTVIIFIRFIDVKGGISTKFLSVKELASTDAHTIYKAVSEALSDPVLM